jgi:timeless
MNSFAVQRTSGASTAQANAPTTQGMSTDPSASKKVTPPKSKGVKAFNNNTYKNPHLIVDKSVVNELLLVCSVIGSTVDPASQKIVPVEDCINWLQDLQRALRRDEDAYRPISLLLGQWKVVEQKLIPLVLSCRYNTPLILTIVKILVILTKPLSESSIKAARVLINAKKSDADPNVIREQAALRENALEQAKLLVEYKRLFVTHPSHYSDRMGRQNQSNKKAPQGGLLSIFVSLLAEPLSRTGVQRSANDHLTIELILHLFRNLLSAGGEQFDGNDNAKTHVEAMLHQELICLFEKEMVLDFLLVVGQEMENRENKQYNLLLMEILHHMLKNEVSTVLYMDVFRMPFSKHITQNFIFVMF